MAQKNNEYLTYKKSYKRECCKRRTFKNENKVFEITNMSFRDLDQDLSTNEAKE